MFRGFTFGIDFEGGTKVSMPAAGENGTVTTQQVEDVFSKTLGKDAESVVIVGSGASATVQIRSETLTNAETEALRTALFDAFQPKGPDGQPSKQAISDSAVSETWGGQITKKALIALVVFLVLVGDLHHRALRALHGDVRAGDACSSTCSSPPGCTHWSGSRSRPATVIGLLTILGFSLYDTVIVFDKVEENTHGFEHTTRRTFAEQANLAINQTFMRSINTSLISVLPIAGADGGRGVAARRRHAEGPGAGAAGRRHRRHLLVDLLRHAAAGDAARAHRACAHAHPPGAQPPQAAAPQGRSRRWSDAEPEECRRRVPRSPPSRRPRSPRPGARPVRPTASRTGRPSGKRNTRRR